jgi:hypothetical protein
MQRVGWWRELCSPLHPYGPHHRLALRACRYNNYLSDPYSAGHPLAAVCGRQDLPPAHHHQHHQHHPAHGSTPQAQAAHRSHRRRGRHLSAEGALSSHQQQQQQPPLSGVRAGRRNAADNIPIIPKASQ